MGGKRKKTLKFKNLGGVGGGVAEQALETIDRNRDLLPKSIQTAVLEERLAEQIAIVSRFGNQIAPVFGEVRGEGGRGKGGR